MEKTTVRHDNVDNCSGTMLAALNLKLIIALCIQHIAGGLNRIKWQDAVCGAQALIELDRSPLELLDCFSLYAVCPECGKIISAKFELHAQLMNVATVFLLQNGYIDKHGVTMPSTEEIIASFDDGMLMEFGFRCQHCLFDDLDVMLTHELNWIQQPKLTNK